MKIVIASDNQGKLKELKGFLQELDMNFIPQSEFGITGPEETGLSFIENAILKARHASTETDLPSIADDSGLCVDALGGAPGIHSARYGGPTATPQDNIHKLLKAIESIKSEEDRTAYFYCAVAFVRHANDPTPLIALGQWHGRILTKPVGEKGFGYDPVFLVPNLNCTVAELERDQKNQISHRAKALKEISEKLKMMYSRHDH